MNIYYLSFVCLLTSISSVPANKGVPGGGYKILAFLPIPSKSHHRVWQPLLKELSLRGHHITYVSPIAMDNPPRENFTHLAFMNDELLMTNTMKRIGTETADVMGMRGFAKHFELMRMMRRWGLSMSQEVLENPMVRKFIQSEQKFDAIILETGFVQDSFIALQHRYNAVTIDVSTTGNWHWTHWIHGNPTDFNYIADSSVLFTDSMTLTEKIQNMVNGIIIRIQWMWYMPQYQDLMDNLLTYPGWQSRPGILEMMSKTSLVLVNTHYSLNYPYPSAPNFKEVGGLNLVPTNPLPKDIKEFMDGAEDGVIYFTLGSFWQVSETLGNKLTPVFIRVFSRLKQRVLMKWETDFPNLPSNIKISKWFPQQDILAHKNLRLFISHGGFLSMTEAVNQGVPILGIPMVGDQLRNIRHVQHYGYGIGLELDTINDDTLSWALEEILNDPKYLKNAKERSSLFRDKPETALETAVFWTEYVIRHKGAEHLRPAIANMPWYQEAMIDVYLAIAAIILIPLYILYRIVTFLFGCCCRTKKQSKRKSD